MVRVIFLLKIATYLMCLVGIEVFFSSGNVEFYRIDRTLDQRLRVCVIFLALKMFIADVTAG